MRPLPLNHTTKLFHAVCLLQEGQLESAISKLENISTWPNLPQWHIQLNYLPFDDGSWPLPAVKAHYWLGVAYDRQGNKAKAVKEFKKFLDIWKNADFKSKELEDAKVRLAKLEGEQ